MKKLTHGEFEEKTLKEHGSDRYLYLTKYAGSRDKIYIECLVCGDKFWQRASHHLDGCSCPKCNTLRKKTNSSWSHSQFEERSNMIHNNKFKYLSIYKNAKSKIYIECLVCGDKFWQFASSHLQGNGCLNCARISRRKTHSNFIEDSNNTHDIKLEILSTYVNSITPVLFKCLVCSNEFNQMPLNHLKGQGCPDCNNGGYCKSFFESRPEMKDNPADLYFYKFWNDNEVFYKVGITIGKRIFNHGGNYKTDLIKNVNTTLYNAWILEQKFINDFRKYKYVPQYKFGGWTECFSKEIYNVMFNN